MSLFNNAAILSFEVFNADFSKKETCFVNGRPFHSLTFRTSGEITLESNGSFFVSGESSITYVPENCSYKTEITESGNMIAIHFLMSEVSEMNNEIKVFTPENATVISNLFHSLLKKNTWVSCDYSAFSVLYEILALLIKYDSSDSDVPEKIRYSKEYFDNNFSDSALSVSETAEKLGISEVYLRREFKAHFGISPLAYLNSLRFENAKAMLKTGYYTISEVAEKCGFMSLSYFSAAFRKAYGISPGKFKKKRGI